MKTLAFIVIFFMMYLIIYHLFKNPIVESLANCSQDQNDLTYQNTATIEQQQKEINDFKKSIEETINKIQKQVKVFDIKLSKNKTKITNNTKSIKSSVSNIHTAALQKEAALDKVSGTSSAS